jgi:hypothetical protein
MERSVARSDKSAQYLMRILPYRGRNNVIEGVLLTFFELTNWSELKPIAGADGLRAGRSSDAAVFRPYEREAMPSTVPAVLQARRQRRA